MRKRKFLGRRYLYILTGSIAVFLTAVFLLYSGIGHLTAHAEEEWQWAEEEWQWTEDDQWAEDEWAGEDDWSEDQWYEEDAWTDDGAQGGDDGGQWYDEEDQVGEELEQEQLPDEEPEPDDAEAAAEQTEEEQPRPEPAKSQPPVQETAPGVQVWPRVPELDGEAVVLMEANTQAVIFEKNAEEKMYPASTTKILTALVVLEHCSLNDMVTFTEECCDLEDGAVTIKAVPGERMTLKDVMYGLLLPSGNDCAMALAIHTAGSVEKFAEMMNEKARQIGAASSHFVNPSGLFSPNHYTTASDLALIARYAFQNSIFVDIISHPTYIIEPTNKTPESRVLTNTHEMIIPGSPDYNSDVIGGKTGYLYESGRCLVTYAQRGGVTLLSVILDGSYYGIFGETQELLDFGWDYFTIVNVSESERRFSYNDENAMVQLDPSSQILTLNNVPFNELSSRINYAYYLDEKEYAQAKEEAGILPGDPRQLYAWIDYYYAGYYLGSCNVFINPGITVSRAQFIDMIYINFWLILLIVIAVIASVILIVRRAKVSSSRSVNAKDHRRSGRARVRYYNRSDSVDLHNQSVRHGARNRESIHRLDEIGINRNTGHQTAVLMT